jgi:hypothetical protein
MMKIYTYVKATQQDEQPVQSSRILIAGIHLTFGGIPFILCRQVGEDTFKGVIRNSQSRKTDNKMAKQKYKMISNKLQNTT